METYLLRGFNWKKTYDKLAKGAERGIVLGDMSDEILERTKNVLSLSIKTNSDKVNFQISPYGKLLISSSDSSKLSKARLRLKQLVGGTWVPISASKEEELSISREAREVHTDELRREVIKPWLEQLPIISLDVFFFQSYFPFGELPVEQNDLFPDLKNHLCFKPNPFESLKACKRKAGELRVKCEKMLTEIDQLVEKEIGLPVGFGWGEKSGEHVHRGLSEIILRSSLHLADGDAEWFNQSLKFKSEMNPSGEYWIGAHGCIKINMGQGKREEHKKRFDEKVKGMIEEMKKQEYMATAGEIVRIIHELESLNEKMKSSLKKHSRVPILLGDCEYYPRMLGAK